MDNQILDNDLNVESPKIIWAGFWMRVGATFIDFFAFLPLIAISMYNFSHFKLLILELLTQFVSLFYKPFMEYYYSATLGKMALNIKVVDQDLHQITFMQSIIKNLPYLVYSIFAIYSSILLFQNPDFLMATNWLEISQHTSSNPYTSTINTIVFISIAISVAFTLKKQGLHDLLANTYCIIVKP